MNQIPLLSYKYVPGIALLILMSSVSMFAQRSQPAACSYVSTNPEAALVWLELSNVGLDLMTLTVRSTITVRLANCSKQPIDDFAFVAFHLEPFAYDRDDPGASVPARYSAAFEAEHLVGADLPARINAGQVLVRRVKVGSVGWVDDRLSTHFVQKLSSLEPGKYRLFLDMRINHRKTSAETSLVSTKLIIEIHRRQRQPAISHPPLRFTSHSEVK